MTGRSGRRDPMPISDLLDAFLARVGGGRAPELTRLTASWDDLAGPPWAGRSRPARFEQSELLVEVPDGATASLLRFKVPDLIARLDGALGHGVVGSVRLRVARGRGRR